MSFFSTRWTMADSGLYRLIMAFFSATTLLLFTIVNPVGAMPHGHDHDHGHSHSDHNRIDHHHNHDDHHHANPSAQPCSHGDHDHHSDNHDHDHDHHHCAQSHDSQANSADFEKALQNYRAQVEKISSLPSSATADMTTLRDLGQSLIAAAQQTHHVLTEEQNSRNTLAEELYRLNILPRPDSLTAQSLALALRFHQSVAHALSHADPVSLGRHTMDIIRRRGPFIGVGVAAFFVLSETSEWAAGAAAVGLAQSAPGVAAVAAFYSATHAGDFLAGLLIKSAPQALKDLSAFFGIAIRAGGLRQYSQSLRDLRAESPIDWTLNPYFASAEISARDELILIVQRPPFWRALRRRRFEAQKAVHPTVALQDLEAISQRFRMTPPLPRNLSVQEKSGLLLARLLSQPQAKLELNALFTQAISYSQNHRTVSTLVRTELDQIPRQIAENLRITLLHALERVQKWKRQVHHWEFLNLIDQREQSLRSLINRLEGRPLTQAEYEMIEESAEHWKRSFEDPQSLIAAVVNAGSNADEWSYALNTSNEQAAFERIEWSALLLVNQREERVRFAADRIGFNVNHLARPLSEIRSELRRLRTALNWRDALSIPLAAHPGQRQRENWLWFVAQARPLIMMLKELGPSCEDGLSALPEPTQMSFIDLQTHE